MVTSMLKKTRGTPPTKVPVALMEMAVLTVHFDKYARWVDNFELENTLHTYHDDPESGISGTMFVLSTVAY